MRWKNDAGWTSEILKVHDGEERDTNDWAWRLSIAEIESDAPFSAFPGVERVLVLLSGNGLRLRFDDGESHALRPPHDQLRFAGERAAFGELIDGPTRDFNLMWKRDRGARGNLGRARAGGAGALRRRVRLGRRADG